MHKKDGSYKKKIFLPDRSRPNPYRRPLLSKRQTTVRSITFVRNWESNSPMGQLSFDLDSILNNSSDPNHKGDGDKEPTISQQVSASPVPVVIASESPLARVLSSHEEIEEEEENQAVEDEDSVPEIRQSHHEPIEFENDDDDDDDDLESPSQTKIKLINKSKLNQSMQHKTSQRTPTSLRKKNVDLEGNESTDSQKTPSNSARRSSRGQLEMPNLFGREKTSSSLKTLKTSTTKAKVTGSLSKARSIVKVRKKPSHHEPDTSLEGPSSEHEPDTSSEHEPDTSSEHEPDTSMERPSSGDSMDGSGVEAEHHRTGDSPMLKPEKPLTNEKKSHKKQATKQRLSGNSSSDSRRSSGRGQLTLPNLFGREKTSPRVSKVDSAAMPPPKINSTVKARRKSSHHESYQADESTSNDTPPDTSTDPPSSGESTGNVPEETNEQHAHTSLVAKPQKSATDGKKSSKTREMKQLSSSASRSRKKSMRQLKIGQSLFGKSGHLNRAPSSPVTPVLPVGLATPVSFNVESISRQSGHVTRTSRTQAESTSPVARTEASTEAEQDAGCDVRVWQGDSGKRDASHLFDIDVLLNRFEEIAWETRQRTESMDVRKALNIFAKGVQTDLRDTIIKATSIKKIESSLTKSQNRLNKKRKHLLAAQRELSELHNEVANLRKVKQKQLHTSQEDVPNTTQETS